MTQIKEPELEFDISRTCVKRYLDEGGSQCVLEIVDGVYDCLTSIIEIFDFDVAAMCTSIFWQNVLMKARMFVYGV